MNSIDRISAQSVSRAYVQHSGDAGAAAAQSTGKADHHARRAPKADSVSLSADAKALAAARDAVQKAPDAREEKVAAIKREVETGTYNVPAHVLARKMVDASKNPA